MGNRTTTVGGHSNFDNFGSTTLHDSFAMRTWSLQLKTYKVGHPFTTAKLVNVTPMSPWFMVFITIVTGVYKPNTAFGGPTL